MATDELHSAVTAAAAPASAAGMASAEEEGEAARGFSFSIWPPTQRTRDAVVRRLVDTLGGDTILCKRYGAVPAADAEPAARGIEAEAFDAAAARGAVAASVEEGIEALQLYSKEVSRRLLDFVKSRSAAAKATAAAKAVALSEGEAPAASCESEVANPQAAE